jgi:hypothetical protein
VDYNAPVNRRSNLLVVAGAMALAALLLIPRLRLPVSYDGNAHYLPMARAVLEQGWGYLSRPESLAYAPVSFLYPALLGANELLVREANIALYCAAIALTFFALKTACEDRAAVLGAFLLAISPTLRPFVADVLTEAPFVFLIAAWALCVAKLAGGAGTKWALAGGVTLALAALLRPAAMYFAPLAMILFAWRRQWRLASLHAIASAGVGLWVLHNAIVFDFPAVAAGAGGALYFGVNPLVDGFDPPYYGLNFDSFEAQEDTTHLSIHADRTLGAIAMVEIRDTPLAVLARMFAHKAAAFVLMSSTEPANEPLPWLRSWRIASVMLAVFATWIHRRSTFVLAIAAFAVYMVAVHVPVLYTHRYSAGAIDLPLAILAAIGGVEVMGTVRRAAIALFAGTLALAAGLVDASTAAPGAPRLELVPHEVAWLANLDRETVVGPGEPIDIAIAPGGDPIQWYLTILQLDLAVNAATPGSCTAMRVRFKGAREERFADGPVVRIPIESDTAMHRYKLGSTVPLELHGSGVVRLQFECGSPASVHVGTVAVISPQREAYYRERYLETKRVPGQR